MASRMRIPSYDEPQVDQRPLSNVNLPTEAPLAAFGGGELAQEASNQASALAGDVAKRAEFDYHNEYKNAVQLQGLELANQLTAEETRAKGALSQVKGKDAIEARDKTLKEYDQYFQKLTKDVTNPDVKQLAQEHYASRRNTLDGWATPYALGQREEYDNNELLSSIKNEADSAAADPSPANVAVAVLSQKLALQEFGERNGRGPDWVKAKQLEASSATHLSALKSIVDAGQNIVAKEFFDRNKAEFVGNDVSRAEELVKAGSSLAAALEVRDKIFRVSHEEVKDKDGAISIRSIQPPVTEAEVRDRLNELTKGMDPQTRLQAEGLAFAQWRQEKEIQASQQMDLFNQADKLIEEPDGNTANIPRSLWLSLTPENRKWLDTRAAQLAKGEKAAAGSDRYFDLLRMSAAKPEEFSKLNLIKDRGNVTGEELKELGKSQASIIKGDGKVDAKAKGFLTVEELGKSMVKDYLTGDDLSDFLLTLDKDYVAWQHNPKNVGRQPDPDEAKAIVDNLVSVNKRWWWKDGLNLKYKEQYEGIDTAERAAIESGMRKRGEIPTKERVTELFNKMHKK